jgi:RNA polymerase sigma-70 factor (ECF subfamily)
LARPALAAAEEQDRAQRLRHLVDAHLELLGRVLRNLGISAADVEDQVQHVLMVAAMKLDSIEPGRERAFLIQTAIRSAARFRRDKARHGEVFDGEPDERPGEHMTPERLVDERAARRTLDRVLGAMDFDLRSVLVLYELEEMTLADIAALLGIPQGTVASRLRRARADFRERARRACGERRTP